MRNLPRDELIEDFRLSCLSRALDDREILLQKQSRVFFQISGAGHEIVLTALARSLRPASDWFFPYYRDRALVLALGVTAKAVMLEAVGSAEDPASGGRQMPCHWGDVDLNIVTQSSPTGSQCLPAVGCAEAARYIAPRPGAPRLQRRRGRGDLRLARRGYDSEGEFWESLNSACKLHLPVLYLVADNGFAISVTVLRPDARAYKRAGARVSGTGRHAASKVGTTPHAGKRARGPLPASAQGKARA